MVLVAISLARFVQIEDTLASYFLHHASCVNIGRPIWDCLFGRVCQLIADIWKDFSTTSPQAELRLRCVPHRPHTVGKPEWDTRCGHFPNLFFLKNDGTHYEHRWPTWLDWWPRTMLTLAYSSWLRGYKPWKTHRIVYSMVVILRLYVWDMWLPNYYWCFVKKTLHSCRFYFVISKLMLFADIGWSFHVRGYYIINKYYCNTNALHAFICLFNYGLVASNQQIRSHFLL